MPRLRSTDRHALNVTRRIRQGRRRRVSRARSLRWSFRSGLADYLAGRTCTVRWDAPDEHPHVFSAQVPLEEGSYADLIRNWRINRPPGLDAEVINRDLQAMIRARHTPIASTEVGPALTQLSGPDFTGHLSIDRSLHLVLWPDETRRCSASFGRLSDLNRWLKARLREGDLALRAQIPEGRTYCYGPGGVPRTFIASAQAFPFAPRQGKFARVNKPDACPHLRISPQGNHGHGRGYCALNSEWDGPGGLLWDMVRSGHCPGRPAAGGTQQAAAGERSATEDAVNEKAAAQEPT